MRKVFIAIACLLAYHATAIPSADIRAQRVVDWRIAHKIEVTDVSQSLELAKLEKKYLEICQKIRTKEKVFSWIEEQLKTIIIHTGDKKLISFIRNNDFNALDIDTNLAQISKNIGISDETILTIKSKEDELISKYKCRFDKIFSQGNDIWDDLKNNNEFCKQEHWLTMKDLTQGNPDAEKLFEDMIMEIKSLRKDILKDLSSEISLDKKEMWEYAKYKFLLSNNLFNSCNIGWEHESCFRYIDQNGDEELKELANYYRRINFDLATLKAHKTYLEEKAEARVKEHTLKELEEASRELRSEEKEDIAPLMKRITEHGIKNIRVIDAETLISGYDLSDRERKYFLGLLREPGISNNVCKAIEDFAKNSCFEEALFRERLKEKYQNFYFLSDETRQLFQDEIDKNPSLSRRVINFCSFGFFAQKSNQPNLFKQVVSDALIYAAKTSDIYKEQIIALMAWSKASPLISNKEVEFKTFSGKEVDFKTRQMIFICGDKGSMAGNNVIVWDLFSIFNTYCLPKDFNDTHIAEKIEVPLDPLKALLHEIGHIILSDLIESTVDRDFNKQKSMEIVSEGFVLNRDKVAVEENLSKIAPFEEKLLKKLMEGSSRNYLRLKEKRGEFFRRIQTDDMICAGRNEFYSQSELAQILGFFGDNKTIYINLLSDFMSSVMVGAPIRINHSGKLEGKTEVKDDLLLEIVERMNKDRSWFGEKINLSPYIIGEQLNTEFFKDLLSVKNLVVKANATNILISEDK